MICSNCKSSFKEDLRYCPLCGHSLTSADIDITHRNTPVENDMSHGIQLSEILFTLLREKGPDILDSPIRVISYVSDVMPLEDRIHTTFVMNCDDELLSIFANALFEGTVTALVQASARAARLLYNERHVSKHIALATAQEIANGIALYLNVSVPFPKQHAAVEKYSHVDYIDFATATGSPEPPGSSRLSPPINSTMYAIRPSTTARFNILSPISVLFGLASQIRDAISTRHVTEQTNAPEHKVPPLISEVRFAAIAPEWFVPGAYEQVDIIMHEDSWAHVVDEIAREHSKAMRELEGGLAEVARGARVRVDLSSPELGHLGTEEREWLGRYQRFGFLFKIPKECAEKEVALHANVFINDVPASRLACAIPRSQSVCREEKAVARAPLLPDRSDIRSAFISYSHDDRARVATIIQGMRTARPDLSVFFDVERLRCGEDWQETLRCEIQRNDMLFLCWSRAASTSRWVDFEWRYALSTKGIDYVEPIAIERPSVCPPPRELRAKHFSDPLLYVIDAQ